MPIAVATVTKYRLTVFAISATVFAVELTAGITREKCVTTDAV